MGNKCLRGSGDGANDAGGGGRPPARGAGAAAAATPPHVSAEGINLGLADGEPAGAPRRHAKLHGDGGLLAVAAVAPGVVVTGGEDGAVIATRWRDRLAVVAHRGDDAHKGDVRHFFHNAAQRLLLSASRDKTVKVWRVAEDTGAPSLLHTLEGHRFVVANVCTNADGTRAVSGSRDNSVRLWDLDAGKQLHMKQTARNLVHGVRWLGESTILQSGENLNLYIWDVRGDRVEMDEGRPNPISRREYQQAVCMATAGDGNSVLIGYKGFDPSQAVLRVWDVRQRKELSVFSGHTNTVTDIAYLPPSMRGVGTGALVVSAAQDRTVRVWDAATQECISSVGVPDEQEAPTDLAVAAAPDGAAGGQLFLGGSSGALSVYEWDAATTGFVHAHIFGGDSS